MQNLSSQLAKLVQQRINTFVASQRTALEPLGADTDLLLQRASDFMRGGKRFRAYATVLGYQTTAPLNFTQPLDDATARVITAASALEVFHAAALIHDDVIDRSETRRGAASAHASMAQHHQDRGWRGSASHFGTTAAILLGDLLQSWADMLMQEATAELPTATAQRTHARFNRMRTEIVLGQYLDVLEEQYPEFSPKDAQLQRATRVLLYKSAKYTVAEPLLIGAALANASEKTMADLSGYGIPAGMAFQLRDDILGVFGDSERTGKPAGDDLIEGKRTVLATLARERLIGRELQFFDEVFGSRDINEQTVEMLRQLIKQTGAVAEVERIIESSVAKASTYARSAEFTAAVSESLVILAKKLAYREI
ncbi:polyprenyl synthetase family protein [Canibacter zhuwentaonis]|uniref:polyprenyl synthetase family protein n=1 Tax=Canibacter zhuwentaonis TaxID=2837491 RepID=UPI00350F9E0E